MSVNNYTINNQAINVELVSDADPRVVPTTVPNTMPLHIAVGSVPISSGVNSLASAHSGAPDAQLQGDVVLDNDDGSIDVEEVPGTKRIRFTANFPAKTGVQALTYGGTSYAGDATHGFYLKGPLDLEQTGGIGPINTLNCSAVPNWTVDGTGVSKTDELVLEGGNGVAIAYDTVGAVDKAKFTVPLSPGTALAFDTNGKLMNTGGGGTAGVTSISTSDVSGVTLVLETGPIKLNFPDANISDTPAGQFNISFPNVVNRLNHNNGTHTIVAGQSISVTDGGTPVFGPIPLTTPASPASRTEQAT